MKQNFEILTKIFQLNGEITSIEQISNGIINQTYDVKMTDGEKERRYVFQRLNIFVFKNPKKIMQNIEKITSHIASKLEAEGNAPERLANEYSACSWRWCCSWERCPPRQAQQTPPPSSAAAPPLPSRAMSTWAWRPRSWKIWPPWS